MKRHNIISVYEHESLKLDGVRLRSDQLKALQKFYGEKGVPYFSLIHNGIKFNQFVGVIRVGNMTIEVLPKADRQTQKEDWRVMLISMLRSVNLFEIHTPSSSSLKLRSNSILDLYFELFLNEVEYLLHRGLTKKYRKTEANISTLKGNILFAQHIQKNLIHKEYFYVRYTTYDALHQLHRILCKAIHLIEQINTNPLLTNKAATLRIRFPEMDDLTVTQATFDKLALNRKTEPYRKALEIARLLLLNFHPDVSRGNNHVLALMFDMNFLWEKFIYASLRKELVKTNSTFKVKSQSKKYFWKPEKGNRVGIRPDIIVQKNNDECFVIDTKWKNLDNLRPSDDDLKQMFVYHDYYKAKKVALAYPGDFQKVQGRYFTAEGNESDKECSLISLPAQKDVRLWQAEIAKYFLSWFNP